LITGENTPNLYGDDDFATPTEDNERMDIIGQNGNDGLHYEEYIPNEPLEENDPTSIKNIDRKGGIKIQ
jgi:hypothetical protein